MAENDNTKTPDEVDDDAPLNEQKTLFQEGRVIVTDFMKSAEEAKKIFDAIPENTVKQKMFKTIMYVVISLSATFAVPLGSLAYSYGEKKAKMESDTRKKKAEAETVRRTLQLDLLKQIIDVAKKAEFKDPRSVYRLGLIAAMVNENHSAFGIKLINAEQTMKSMSDRLAPIAGLRKRLTESRIFLTDLQNKYKSAKKEETTLNKRIKEINKTLKVTKYIGAWRKKKLEKELLNKENELDHQKVQRRFYQERLGTEQKVRVYFSTELKRQEKLLKDTLQQTTDLRDRLKKRSAEVAGLATKLEKGSKSTKSTVTKFKKALVKMHKVHSRAEQTIKRLRAELRSERLASNSMLLILKAYSKQLKICKTKSNTTVTTKPSSSLSKGSAHRRSSKKKKRLSKVIKAYREGIPSSPLIKTTESSSSSGGDAMKVKKKFFKKRRALDGLYVK